MHRFGKQLAQTRARNSRALSAFGFERRQSMADAVCRRIHDGQETRLVYTVGYERRSGAELLTILKELGVELLLDVRDRPMSRKPDFRESSLRVACEASGITYESWPKLGSTPAQRERLRQTGDYEAFRGRFRAFVKRHRGKVLTQLAQVAESKTIALLCYERVHEECHRSVIAEALFEQLGATVIAIS